MWVSLSIFSVVWVSLSMVVKTWQWRDIVIVGCGDGLIAALIGKVTVRECECDESDENES